MKATPGSSRRAGPRALVRELMKRVNRIGALDARKPEQARLTRVIVDERRGLRAIPLQLPMPANPAPAGERWNRYSARKQQ